MNQQFQNWKPIHEQVALLAAAGGKPKDIASKLDRSVGWVNLVLLDPRAIKIVDEWLVELRNNLFKKFDDQILELAGFALKNLRRTVVSHPDPVKEFQRKQHQDKISVDILKMAGVGYQDRPTGALVQLTKEESKLLVAAIDTSNEAKEIFDAEYEVIEEPNGKATATH